LSLGVANWLIILVEQERAWLDAQHKKHLSQYISPQTILKTYLKVALFEGDTEGCCLKFAVVSDCNTCPLLLGHVSEATTDLILGWRIPEPIRLETSTWWCRPKKKLINDKQRISRVVLPFAVLECDGTLGRCRQRRNLSTTLEALHSNALHDNIASILGLIVEDKVRDHEDAISPGNTVNLTVVIRTSILAALDATVATANERKVTSRDLSRFLIDSTGLECCVGTQSIGANGIRGCVADQGLLYQENFSKTGNTTRELGVPPMKEGREHHKGRKRSVQHL
jgi:hypothetical protein